MMCVICKERLREERETQLNQLNKLNFLTHFSDKDAPMARKGKVQFWHLMMVAVVFLIAGALVKKAG
jgi:hypothetical protein